MKLTIIKEDNAVYIDGVSRTVCSALDFHALQWDDVLQHGDIEYPVVTCPTCKGTSKKPNLPITDISAYQSYVAAWTAAAPVTNAPR
jgi:hypothetical protein